MMEMLRLGDAIIGNFESGNGISLEERKRLTIDIELVAKLHTLFLDGITLSPLPPLFLPFDLRCLFIIFLSSQNLHLASISFGGNRSRSGRKVRQGMRADMEVLF